MYRYVKTAVVATLILFPTYVQCELVLVAPGGAPAEVANIEAEVFSKGRVLIANPHSGTLLLEVDDDRPLHFDSPVAVHRHVERFPVTLPDSVRVLVDINAGVLTREILQDELRDFVEKWGGREVWRSAMLSHSHFDLPVATLQHVLHHPLIKAFWFDRPGKPDLAQAVPHIGVAGYYDPYYWPWGNFYYIAVLDTGVVDGNPLSGRVDHTLGACFSTPPSTQFYSTCPSGQDEQYGVGAAVPCSLPHCDHGSHVASVAVSAASPNLGVIAVSNVKVLPIQIYSATSKGALFAFESNIVKAFDYILQAGMLGFRVAAINISTDIDGFPYRTNCDSSPLTSWVNALNNFKIPVIASAGNVLSSDPADGYNQVYYWGVGKPACISSVIAVGATEDTNDNVAFDEPFFNAQGNTVYFSSRSYDLLDFWAPGAYIRTPISFTDQFGTSFAAPLVAGVWTRLRARYPSASNAYIKSLLATCPQATDSRPGIPHSITKPRVCWKPAWH